MKRTLLHHPNDVFTLLRDHGDWIERDEIIAHAGLGVRFSDDEAVRNTAIDRAMTQLRDAGHTIEQREEAGKIFYRLQQP